MQIDNNDALSENHLDALMKTQHFFECELKKKVDEIATEEA